MALFAFRDHTSHRCLAYSQSLPTVDTAGENGGAVKFALWCLAIGLEVWAGVFAILMGVFTLMSIVVMPAQLQSLIGCLLTICGGVLVADAVRRELRVRVVKKMEWYGNPLDSPTQA
jgi:hypothetical protein